MLLVCFLPLEFNVLKSKSHLFYLTQFLEKCLAHIGNMLNDLIYGKATTPSLALTERACFLLFYIPGTHGWICMGASTGYFSVSEN